VRIRSVRRELVLAPFLLFLGAAALSAQHLPVGGCRAAASCAGPRGFKSLLDFAGEGNPPLFSIGASYQGRLALRVVKPARPDPADSRAVDAAVALFLKRHPLRVPVRPDGATGTKPQNPDRPRS
jgi:hypothetical protein